MKLNTSNRRNMSAEAEGQTGSPPGRRNRPGVASEAIPKVSLAATTTSVTQTDEIHGAELAEQAAQAWKVFDLEQRIRQVAQQNGRLFGSDEIPTIDDGLGGNWIGGVYRRLHHEGVIKIAGYRGSSKVSRSGSIITVWTAGDAS